MEYITLNSSLFLPVIDLILTMYDPLKRQLNEPTSVIHVTCWILIPKEEKGFLSKIRNECTMSNSYNDEYYKLIS